ncbi:glycoside hydrolase 15 protein [Phlyctochytrium bullatum]|nr:glycoside hydrolase 15 protein [Phlyctochytrium bullatum]
MRSSVFVAALTAFCAAIAAANPIHLERRAPVTQTPNPNQPASNVAMQSFTWDESTAAISGTIWVKNLAFTKVVKAIYSSPAGNWNNGNNQLTASYKQSVANGFELWTFSATAPLNLGTNSLLYLKYDVNGQSYFDNNAQQNYKLSGGSNPPPPPPPPPPPSGGETPVTEVAGFHPNDGRNVLVNRYSCKGSTLSGAVWVRNLGFTKSVLITASNPAGNQWTFTVPASFSGQYEKDGSWELWTFSKTLYGIGSGSQFYVKYDVQGQTFYDSNNSGNYKISCVAPPTVSKGFQSDVDSLFTSSFPKVKTYLFNNISPLGVPKGFIVAGGKEQPSTTQDYYFFWTRDSALVMDAVNGLYANDSSYEKYFWDYLDISKKLQNAPTLSNPNLGEPKFTKELKGYSEPWCRPQDDGPALRVNGLVRFITNYLLKGGSLDTVRDIYNGPTYGIIKRDLEFLMQNGTYNDNCDLWEELRGNHFFTQSATRTALKFGANLARRLGDTAAASRYAAEATRFDAIVNKYWFQGSIWSSLNAAATDGLRQFDAAIPLSAIHTAADDGVFAATDDRILSTIYNMAVKMIAEFPVNQKVTADASARPLAPAVGRYFADKYNGITSDYPARGNPWYLTTLAYAETYYQTAAAYLAQDFVPVTPLLLDFVRGERPAGLGLPNMVAGTYRKGSLEYRDIVNSLIALADEYVRRAFFHALPDSHFSEQFGRADGNPGTTSIADLTWSYASVITTYLARIETVKLYNI